MLGRILLGDANVLVIWIQVWWCPSGAARDVVVDFLLECFIIVEVVLVLNIIKWIRLEIRLIRTMQLFGIPGQLIAFKLLIFRDLI